MTTEILTFGCRLNLFESEVIRGHTAQLADTVVVNSCAVTTAAERQARAAIARLHRTRPEARIVVTGCAAQIDPARWAALPGVRRVLGNEEKMRAESWQEGAPAAAADIMRAGGLAAHPVSEFAGRARALIQIQQGCDHRCTFCVIPFGRGPNRSVPMPSVADQLRRMVAGGYQEAVLTGVDIASYGTDLPGQPRLPQLLRHLLAAVPELPRLRLSSLDPVALDDDFFAVLAGETRLMPHLHLSLQSGAELILKRMKRRHSAAGAAAAIAKARLARPGIAIGADLIAGFPTETDGLFRETAEFLEAQALPYLHVFPYSERPGTPAARMKPVPHPVRRERAAALREIGQRAASRFHAGLLGSRAQVLTEAGGGGHTEHFAPVRLLHPLPPGRLLAALITGADAKTLRAEAA
jgi:threonylcarbamoyladenosine tRNA methylthiotransferase MtaB